MSSAFIIILHLFIFLDLVFCVHIEELKKRSDIKLYFKPIPPGPNDKLCSYFMDQLIKLADEISDEIKVKNDDTNSSFQYFLKRVTETGKRNGISSKTPCISQMVTGFKPDNNLLYDYWSHNFRSKL